MDLYRPRRARYLATLPAGVLRHVRLVVCGYAVDPVAPRGVVTAGEVADARALLGMLGLGRQP